MRLSLSRFWACTLAAMALAMLSWVAPAAAQPIVFTFSGALNGSFEIGPNTSFLYSGQLIGTGRGTTYGILAGTQNPTGDFVSIRNSGAGFWFFQNGGTGTSGLPASRSIYSLGIYQDGWTMFQGPQLWNMSQGGVDFPFATYSNMPTVQGGGVRFTGPRTSLGTTTLVISPGAPAPEVGGGLLAAAATVAGLVMARVMAARGKRPVAA